MAQTLHLVQIHIFPDQLIVGRFVGLKSTQVPARGVLRQRLLPGKPARNCRIVIKTLGRIGLFGSEGK